MHGYEWGYVGDLVNLTFDHKSEERLNFSFLISSTCSLP